MVGIVLVSVGMEPAWWLLIQAGILLAALVFERSGYHPVAPDRAALRRTGERFNDPTTGQTIEVWEDPATGAREYRPIAESRQ